MFDGIKDRGRDKGRAEGRCRSAETNTVTAEGTYFASSPYRAVFTSAEVEILEAMAWASLKFGAPWILMRYERSESE